MNELVSIVSTLYNYRRFVKDLIVSVIRQTYPYWELIIVDDCSTDRPLENVIHRYLKDKRIQYIRLAKNCGYSIAKNEGVVRSKGKYIVMIDADDMLTKGSIEIRKKLLDNNPDKLWCHGEVLVKNNNSLSDCSIIWKRSFRKRLVREGWDLTKQYHHRLIHAQSVMLRPELHKKLGLYDESLRFSADNEMWRRVIRFGHIPAHTEEFVAIYRVHPDRMSRSKYKAKRKAQVKKKIITDVEQRFKDGINSENTRLWL